MKTYTVASFRLALFLAFAFCCIPHVHAQKDDLLAHDISGYALDMTVAQVEAVAHTRLRPLGGSQYNLIAGGVKYNFEFSVTGHLFRIDSQQTLGRFLPDDSFARTLTRKLVTKFGPPDLNELPNGPISWEHFATYHERSGQVVNRPTISLSALLLGGWGEPITLNMKLLDFRIMGRDLSKANAIPRSRAEGDAKF